MKHTPRNAHPHPSPNTLTRARILVSENSSSLGLSSSKRNDHTILAMRIFLPTSVCLALILLLPSVNFAQIPRHSIHPVEARTELELGSVTVWLGMAEADALAQLQAAGYRVTGSPSETSRIIVNASEIYTVWFKQGKLIFTARSWSTKKSVMAAVLGALTSLEDRGARSCVISHQPLRKPNMSNDRVFIECGQRSVELSDGTVDIDGKEYSTTEVSERIGTPE